MAKNSHSIVKTLFAEVAQIEHNYDEGLISSVEVLQRLIEALATTRFDLLERTIEKLEHLREDQEILETMDGLD